MTTSAQLLTGPLARRLCRRRLLHSRSPHVPRGGHMQRSVIGSSSMTPSRRPSSLSSLDLTIVASIGKSVGVTGVRTAMPIAGNSASLVEIAGENLTAVTAVCAVRRNRSAGNSAGKAATSAVSRLLVFV